MKRIETLVEDIKDLFENGTEIIPEALGIFGGDIARILGSRMVKRQQSNALRFSNIGSKCERKLWYNCNEPDKRISLPPEVKLKFLYGDILEALLLLLCREAGHRVEGEQTEFDINGVKGHRDAVIDGVTVDVKSASSFSFDRFANGLKPEDDKFGYLAQLSGYVSCGKHDSAVVDKHRGAFLVIDKTLGKLCLDIHEFKDDDFADLVRRKQQVVRGPLPNRGFFDVPDGKSGNRKLDTECSYCDFSRHCWPNSRRFAYAGGIRILTHIARLPDVPEIE